ncbi:hypothetical protein BDQ94DRAFT_149005, partial [Aspergillus welwitschiae]
MNQEWAVHTYWVTLSFHILYIMGLIDKLVARKHRLHTGTGPSITEYGIRQPPAAASIRYD